MKDVIRQMEERKTELENELQRLSGALVALTGEKLTPVAVRRHRRVSKAERLAIGKRMRKFWLAFRQAREAGASNRQARTAARRAIAERQ